jgi:hypothetical protein
MIWISDMNLEKYFKLKGVYKCLKEKEKE